jgi:hypothetical protein
MPFQWILCSASDLQIAGESEAISDTIFLLSLTYAKWPWL